MACACFLSTSLRNKHLEFSEPQKFSCKTIGDHSENYSERKKEVSFKDVSGPWWLVLLYPWKHQLWLLTLVFGTCPNVANGRSNISLPSCLELPVIRKSSSCCFCMGNKEVSYCPPHLPPSADGVSKHIVRSTELKIKTLSIRIPEGVWTKEAAR